MAISPYTQDNEKKKFKESTAVAGQPGVVVVNADGSSVGGGSVTSVVPGTGATNLGKAEDAAHTSGDTGVFMLAVRNSAQASFTGIDGDYSPVGVTATGAVLTDSGKTEDATHTSGDIGSFVLSKRTDTAASSAGTDGDYATFNTDSLGHLWSREGYAPVAEDNTVGVYKVEQRFTPTYISTATTTTIKSGAGFLHAVIVNGGTAGTIIFYDNTAGSGTILASFDSTNALETYMFNVTFSTGLTVVTGAATKVTVGSR